jgi:hypothetical protein
MNPAWAAGSVRSVALARRRFGPDAAAAIASGTALDEAVAAVARSPYGHDVRAGSGLADAEHGVAATLLWNVRVLAGWLPAAGTAQLRLLAGWFEIANIDGHMAGLDTAYPTPPSATFHLGALATAWPRVAAAISMAELRAALAASPWGDPGDGGAREVSLYLRLAWADRVASGIAAVRPLSAGAAALVIARERFAGGRTLPAAALTPARRLLGPDALTAMSLIEYARWLPAEARWAVAGTTDPDQLWRNEARWWRRLRRDGGALLRRTGFGAHRPLGAVALLAADAWQTRAALQICAHGTGREVLDEAA